MVPLIKRSTDILVEQFEEEAVSKKSFNIHKWVVLRERERETTNSLSLL